MQLNEYQQRAARTAIYPNRGNNLPYVTLGLCGEAGEVANKVKNGTPSAELYPKILDEAGDVLWYLSQLAHELGTNLQVIADLNLAKLEGRAIQGDHDHGR